MDLKGEYRIAASRAKVWEALNDPDILKQCITGCEELVRDSDGGFAAKVTAKVGPIKAKFKGKVTLSDIDAPNGYTITGEGQGGVAGFAKGGAKVKLTEDGDVTILNYEATAQVGGKLASVGSRLIDSVAKKNADDFFSKFSKIVGGEDVVAQDTLGEQAGSGAVSSAREGGFALNDPRVLWVAGIIGLGILVYFFAF